MMLVASLFAGGGAAAGLPLPPPPPPRRRGLRPLGRRHDGCCRRWERGDRLHGAHRAGQRLHGVLRPGLDPGRLCARPRVHGAGAHGRVQARDEFIAGEETAAKLKTELAATIGKQAVAFAAGGVDLGSYSVGRARAQAIDDGEAALAGSRNDAIIAAIGRRMGAKALYAQAGSAKIAGFLHAAGQLGDLAGSVAARG
jgi:hypothetical protein